MKRVSFASLKVLVNIIRENTGRDIRLSREGRHIVILEYQAYEPNQPSVVIFNSNRQALEFLEEELKNVDIRR